MMQLYSTRDTKLTFESASTVVGDANDSPTAFNGTCPPCSVDNITVADSEHSDDA
jgi:hypothetical protein